MGTNRESEFNAEGAEIPLATSCYRNQYKLGPCAIQTLPLTQWNIPELVLANDSSNTLLSPSLLLITFLFIFLLLGLDWSD